MSAAGVPPERIGTLAVSGYRSLRDVVLPLSGLTVVTGPNGSGKSSLYRALSLLAACADGSVVGALARERGLTSALWAGPESARGARRHGGRATGTVRSGPISLLLGVGPAPGADGDPGLGYLVDLGLPPPAMSRFVHDPQVKREVVFAGSFARPGAHLVKRQAGLVQASVDGTWSVVEKNLPLHRSIVSEHTGNPDAPELARVRRTLRAWRFHHGFRVDAEAPARRPQVGTRTPVLASDGHDLAAALLTIQESGWVRDLEQTVADAFDGARLEVLETGGLLETALRQHGLLRPLRAAELSDGTLRYLGLAAALLSPEAPGLLVLNEPEASLHPSLLPALARLIVRAAERSQVIVVTHADALVQALDPRDPFAEDPDTEDAIEDGAPTLLTLEKRDGETVVSGQGPLQRPPWEWGSR